LTLRPVDQKGPKGNRTAADGPVPQDEPAEPNESSDRPPEELVLYGLLVVIGAIPVGLAVASGTRLGAPATLGLLMMFAGIIGVLVDARGRRKA
jgi:hypothetical protein